MSFINETKLTTLIFFLVLLNINIENIKNNSKTKAQRIGNPIRFFKISFGSPLIFAVKSMLTNKKSIGVDMSKNMALIKPSFPKIPKIMRYPICRIT
ncbi:MAG: hypothetical protein LBR15_03310 [Methanobrevibacter sp.]|nr:hypothetical protein [Candidatus Methanovirga australis]